MKATQQYVPVVLLGSRYLHLKTWFFLVFVRYYGRFLVRKSYYSYRCQPVRNYVLLAVKYSESWCLHVRPLKALLKIYYINKDVFFFVN